MDETIKKGKFDMGMNVFLNEDGANIAAGMACADPGKLESKIKSMVGDNPQLQDAAEIKLNSERFNNVNFHEIVVPTPDDQEEMANLFGDNITVLIGFGSDCIYFGAGSSPMANLKDSMNASASDEKLPMQFNLFVAPLLKKISEIDGDATLVQMAETLEGKGNDRVRITSEAIENGISMRIEVQDGLIALIGIAGQAFGGMGPGADF
jgi:hypothetical protein